MKLNKKGFTLVELLAVIVVLGIISLIGYSVVVPLIADARDGANARTIESFEKELKTQCLSLVTKGQTSATDLTAAKIYENASNSKNFSGTVPISTASAVSFTAGDTSCDISISGNVTMDGKTCTKNTNGSWKCGE